MTDGRAASSARRTASRSRRSTADQRTPGRAAGSWPPARAIACTSAPPATRRSSRWPPANPVAPVTSGRPCTSIPGRSAAAVPFLAVPPEGRILILDRPPPRLVLPVPADGGREPGVEVLARRPAERRQLRRVERVAPIVARAIRHRCDERRRPPDERQNPVREIDVLHLVAAADVVDLARHPLVDQQVDAAAVILDVQPVALVLAVAVERHRNAVDQVGDEQRN